MNKHKIIIKYKLPEEFKALPNQERADIFLNNLDKKKFITGISHDKESVTFIYFEDSNSFVESYNNAIKEITKILPAIYFIEMKPFKP